MKFKENRPLAIISVTILMIISLFTSGYVSLASQKRTVENYFYDTMIDDLNTKSAYADNLKGIASRYLDANSEYILKMRDARTMLQKSNNPKQYYTASVLITDAASALYDVLGAMNLTETDDRLRRSNYTNITAVDDILKRNDFNEKVEKYNKEISIFPATLIAFVAGLDDVDYFR